MSREDDVHLPEIQYNLTGRLRTFWFRRLRRIAPALFRLFNITTLTTVHVLFSMARLPACGQVPGVLQAAAGHPRSGMLGARQEKIR